MSSVAFYTSPAGQASTRFFVLCAQVLQPASRHASSYRRSRSRLNVKPDASFLPSKTEILDHIIHNPPPSMPNVYHTPTLFLPKSDKRRQIQSQLSSPTTQAYARSSMISKPDGAADLPPLVAPVYEKRYHVTAEQVEEIQMLRKQDPLQWTAGALAKKYDCTARFVAEVIRGLSPEKIAQQQLVKDVVKSRWGPKRRTAREDRAIRKERYLRDG